MLVAAKETGAHRGNSDPGGQSVEPVNQVEGVDRRDHEKPRQRKVDRRPSRDLGRNRRDPEEKRDHHQLREQFARRREHHRIVDDADCQQRHHPRRQPGRQVAHEAERSNHRQHDSDTAQHRRRLRMPGLFARRSNEIQA